jgi:hypothetical protein
MFPDADVLQAIYTIYNYGKYVRHLNIYWLYPERGILLCEKV